MSTTPAKMIQCMCVKRMMAVATAATSKTSSHHSVAFHWRQSISFSFLHPSLAHPTVDQMKANKIEKKKQTNTKHQSSVSKKKLRKWKSGVKRLVKDMCWCELCCNRWRKLVKKGKPKKRNGNRKSEIPYEYRMRVNTVLCWGSYRQCWSNYSVSTLDQPKFLKLRKIEWALRFLMSHDFQRGSVLIQERFFWRIHYEASLPIINFAAFLAQKVIL